MAARAVLIHVVGPHSSVGLALGHQAHHLLRAGHLRGVLGSVSSPPHTFDNKYHGCKEEEEEEEEEEEDEEEEASSSQR